MKILLISWYFPPANTIGAVRLGRMAQALLHQGHDVRVLAGKDLPYPQTLPTTAPAECVTYARWFDVNYLPKRVVSVLKPLRRGERNGGDRDGRPSSGDQRDAAGDADPKRLSLSDLYIQLTNFPDGRVGWLPAAIRAGHRLLDRWEPDVIYASGPPFTGVVVGDYLSRRHRLPLVVELRDRWSDDPYYPPPALRRALEHRLEIGILSRALALVTVSEPWAEQYRRRYGKPVEVVYNGYDAASTPAPARPDSTMGILYTGGIYPGRRDPSPLFEAIRLLGEAAESIRVDFLGTDEAAVLPLARRHGVEARVRVLPAVPHAQALELQRAADVLLLMQWDDPREQGNVPGKFFEYLGARRPILLLGLKGGVPDTLIRERQAGFSDTHPEAIARQLRTWLDQKRSTGIRPTPEGAARGFSREEQFARIVPFLEACLHDRAQPSLETPQALGPGATPTEP